MKKVKGIWINKEKYIGMMKRGQVLEYKNNTFYWYIYSASGTTINFVLLFEDKSIIERLSIGKDELNVKYN